MSLTKRILIAMALGIVVGSLLEVLGVGSSRRGPPTK